MVVASDIRTTFLLHPVTATMLLSALAVLSQVFLLTQQAVHILTLHALSEGVEVIQITPEGLTLATAGALAVAETVAVVAALVVMQAQAARVVPLARPRLMEPPGLAALAVVAVAVLVISARGFSYTALAVAAVLGFWAKEATARAVVLVLGAVAVVLALAAPQALPSVVVLLGGAAELLEAVLGPLALIGAAVVFLTVATELGLLALSASFTPVRPVVSRPPTPVTYEP